jgi:hypothetical protein
MTTRIALLIALAVAALAIVPTALAQGRLVGSPEDAVKYFRAYESATPTFPPVIHDHGDATQAKLVLRSTPVEVIRDHGDATQAKLAALLGVGSADQAEAPSGLDVNWSQVGIGFLLGVLLAAGLWMGARVAKRHVLAH